MIKLRLNFLLGYNIFKKQASRNTLHPQVSYTMLKLKSLIKVKTFSYN